MGNSRSRPLNLDISGREAALIGEKFATFNMVWEEKMTAPDDKYESLARRRRVAEERRGQQADCAHGPIYKLAQLCSQAWDEHQDEQQRRNWLKRMVDDAFSVITEATGLASNVDNGPPKVKTRNPENLSGSDKKAAQKIVNMFGMIGKHNNSRAHQIPACRACNIFWGAVCEALSGFDMRGFDDEKKLYVRTEMARELAGFQMNLFAFETMHNPYYDLLEGGQCVMIIPLLTLDDIANWKQGEGHEVLICCDSEQTHRDIVCSGGWSPYDDEKTGERMRELKHIKWEDDGDEEMARKVLTAHVEALADSLNIHWNEYHNKVWSSHQEFASKIQNMTDAYEDLVKNGGRVGVPTPKQNRGRKKFFKIDLGELYSGEFKKQIPDPGLFAFKAAVNWSGCTEATRNRKLLSCCSPLEKSDEESYPSYLSLPPSVTEIREHGISFRGGSDLGGRTVWVVGSEDGHSVVSDVSDDDAKQSALGLVGRAVWVVDSED